MRITKFAIALAGAGALLALYATAFGPADSPAVAAPAAVSSVGALEPIHGLAPLSEVVALFSSRAEERPNDYLSRTQLGQALSAQAREAADLEGYEAAEVALGEALSLNPSWKPAQLALAGVLHAQHRFREAQDLAQAVVDTDPSSLSALAILGDARLEQGDLVGAAVAYEDLAESERSAPVVSRLARLTSLQGDAEQALALASEALSLSENLAQRPSSHAFYWFQLGRMHFDIGDEQAAIEAYTTARSIDPGNAAATEALAFTMATQGDHGTAATLYEELIASGPAADLHGAYADSLRALGRNDEAETQEAIGARLAEETKDRFPAERRHLVGFYQDRDPAVAVELATLDLQDRQDIGAYDALAWSLYQEGNYAEAAMVLEQAPAGDPPYASMLYHWAEIQAATGSQVEALRLVQAALDANSSFHPVEAPAAVALVETLTS